MGVFLFLLYRPFADQERSDHRHQKQERGDFDGQPALRKNVAAEFGRFGPGFGQRNRGGRVLDQQERTDHDVGSREKNGRNDLRRRKQPLLGRLHFQHHDDEQKQDHDGSGVHNHHERRQKRRPEEIKQKRAAEKPEDQVDHGMHQIAPGDGDSGGGHDQGGNCEEE